MSSVQNDTLKTGSAERQTMARYSEVASVVQNQVLSSFCGNCLWRRPVFFPSKDYFNVVDSPEYNILSNENSAMSQMFGELF
jgi:hypothetical protein